MKKPSTATVLYFVICVLTGALITTLYLLSQKPLENALRVKYDGHVTILRYPLAYAYSEGDTISVHQEDGTEKTAIVIEPVTVTNKYQNEP